ncbi:hypothetical protein LTS10_003027 [Elasticomyces elasticus]|nr:hypothetical protein LTS10_003027 [Elasticomyces elasticus]
MIIDFTRPRNRKKEDIGKPMGRLYVGHRLRDWIEVYYQPISHRDLAADDEDDEKVWHNEPPALGLFRRKHGEPTVHEPMEGEVLWLPHFDPKRFESTSGKEKGKSHKEFMFNAWRYLATSDPVKLAAMVARFETGYVNWRRWESWFEAASKYKSLRANGPPGRNGGGGGASGPAPRRPGPHPDGGPDDDLDWGDEGYDDDGKVGLGRRGSMGPPPPPKRKQPDDYFMSGGAGSPPASRARTTYSPSINGDDLEDNDDPESLDYDIRHPTMDPEPGLLANGVNGQRRSSLEDRLNNGSRTPNGTLGVGLNGSPNAPGRRRQSSIAPNNDLRPFNDWGRGATGSPTRGTRPGSARPGTLGRNGRGFSGNAQNIVDLDDEPDADDDNINVNPGRGGTAQRESAARGSRAHSIVDDINGADMDEDEATRRAIEQSKLSAAEEAARLAAEQNAADDEDADDPDLQRAIRASMEPRNAIDRPPSGEQGSPNDVHQSIEDGEDEDDL